MPISLEYDGEENVVYTTATGAIAFSDITGYFSSIKTLNVRAGYRVLADYSEASFNLSYDNIERMAREREKMGGDEGEVRIAVHCRDDLVYGLGRTYRALLDGGRYSVMIFRTRKEAKDWLGL